MKENEKNIILFIGKISNSNLENVERLELYKRRKFRTAVITSNDFDLDKNSYQKGIENRVDYVLRCEVNDVEDIKKTICHIQDKVEILFCNFESWMPLYSKIIQIIKDVKVPTAESVKICSSKLEMRKKFIDNYPEITPSFILVESVSEIKDIEKKVGFPCITKPLNFSKSRFIVKSNNAEELKINLKNTFDKIEETYRKAGHEVNSLVLAEEYMEGDMYSTDIYVNSEGVIYFTPIVRVVTGKDIGIDDFFNYYRLVPSDLDLDEEKISQAVVVKSIKSVGITSSTVHVELIKTKEGDWKIIELQSRPGGYRNEMLKLSYGINHHMNDLLIKIGEEPVISKEIKSYTAVIEIFPEKEGKIKSIIGVEEIEKMDSFYEYKQIKKVGEMCGYSRDGYINVLRITLNHKNKNILKQDLSKVGDIVKIELE